MMAMSNGNQAQKRMAQDALNRFWFPALMMFGPSDKESVHSAQSMAWRIKMNTNDELRQKFVHETVPQAKYLGLKIPDEQLVFNEETGQHIFTEPEWDEFNRVLKGDGPCNTERLEVRAKAWEDGTWVRDGMMAHAEKRASQELQRGKYDV